MDIKYLFLILIGAFQILISSERPDFFILKFQGGAVPVLYTELKVLPNKSERAISSSLADARPNTGYNRFHYVDSNNKVHCVLDNLVDQDDLVQAIRNGSNLIVPCSDQNKEKVELFIMSTSPSDDNLDVLSNFVPKPGYRYIISVNCRISAAKVLYFDIGEEEDMYQKYIDYLSKRKSDSKIKDEIQSATQVLPPDLCSIIADYEALTFEEWLN